MTKKDGWIRVEDRLPEDDLPQERVIKTVMVYTRGKKVTIASRCFCWQRNNYRGEEIPSHWEWSRGFSEKQITHWMPLPEPPKEEC